MSKNIKGHTDDVVSLLHSVKALLQCFRRKKILTIPWERQSTMVINIGIRIKIIDLSPGDIIY